MPAAAASSRRSIARLAAVAALAVVSGCISTDEQLRTLQQYNAISSSPSTDPGYDYSVVIRNLEPLGVDMSKVGRERLVAAYLGTKCPNPKVASETELATTMPGQGPTVKDYAVRVKC